MGELLRVGLLVVMCAAAVVVALGVGVAWLSERPRLMRAFRAGLAAPADAALIAHGSGKGVALSLETGLLVTAWDKGGWRLSYPLAAILGAEIDIDGEVAARVMRSETRRRLDRPGAAQREVRLRLMFDDPRHPDFELTLWPCRPGKDAPQIPREAAAEANRWLGRVEAILKRTGPGALRSTPAQVRPSRTAGVPIPLEDEGDLFDDFGDEDEDALAE
ncbi:MAG TPA: hypothetical protein VMU37_03055 [Caulobacteraceae bacterium]|nr:hypothetical protein [Caulobacteraceae bacterium]